MAAPTGSTATKSLTSEVVQAAGQVVIETAKTVATQVRAKNAGDLKDIASNLEKEVIVAKNDDGPSVAEQVEEVAKDVDKDVTEGVQKAGKAVEAHPELLLEGAVVAATAAIGLVAPTLAVGAVAVVGKMAADSAMKTIDGIAVDTSTGVVNDISKDLAKDVAGDAKKATEKKADGETGVASTKQPMNTPATSKLMPASVETATAVDTKTSGDMRADKSTATSTTVTVGNTAATKQISDGSATASVDAAVHAKIVTTTTTEDGSGVVAVAVAAATPTDSGSTSAHTRPATSLTVPAAENNTSDKPIGVGADMKEVEVPAQGTTLLADKASKVAVGNTSISAIPSGVEQGGLTTTSEAPAKSIENTSTAAINMSPAIDSSPLTQTIATPPSIESAIPDPDNAGVKPTSATATDVHSATTISASAESSASNTAKPSLASTAASVAAVTVIPTLAAAAVPTSTGAPATTSITCSVPASATAIVTSSSTLGVNSASTSAAAYPATPSTIPTVVADPPTATITAPPETTAAPLGPVVTDKSSHIITQPVQQPTYSIVSSTDVSLAQIHQKIDAMHETLQKRQNLDELHRKLDAMQDALEKMTKALVQVIQAQSQAQAQAQTTIFKVSEVPPLTPAPSMVQSSPPSLITPSIPAPALATLPGVQEHGEPGSKAIGESVTEDSTTKRYTMLGSLGRLFYLRS